MEDIKDKLNNLIENNKIEEAIKLLKVESAKRGRGLDPIIISLSSRYKRYKKDSLMGLEARDQEFSKIVSDSLELVRALEDPSQISTTEPRHSEPLKAVSYSKTPTPAAGKSNKFVQMGIGGLAVIGLIALIAVFMGGDEDTGSDNSNGSQVENLSSYDVSGHWRQVAQSFGPENDCLDCAIDITQDGESIAVNSNAGWFADLYYDSQSDGFLGTLTWGDISPDDPPQSTLLFWDTNSSELVIQTFIQGAEYNIYYQQ